MDNNKIIIALLVIIIAILLVGIVALMPNMTKQDTKLTFKSKSTLTEGDLVKFQLTSANGTPLANQTINITVTDTNKDTSDYSVVTDDDGVGSLQMNENSGKYRITCLFTGNGDYNGCNASKKVKIEEKVAEVTSSSSSSSLPYSIDNLPPSNDPYPETNRYQVDEYFVVQEYADNYRSTVDLRTGERHGGFF